MSRSSETLGSPASIFATRDWLEFNLRASSPCVKPCARRLERNAWLTVSTKAAQVIGGVADYMLAV